MKFQDIDFHVELYKAYCEPPGAQIEYLNRIRKKGGYKNEGFILKLDEAFKNLKKAFENELNHKKSRTRDPEFLNSFGFPISGLNRYAELIPFSTNFTSHISKVTLVHLTELINQFKIHSTVKKVSKILNEIESNSPLQSKTQESSESKKHLGKSQSPGSNNKEESNQSKSIYIDINILDSLVKGLNQYFVGFKDELTMILKGQKINQKLYFESTGNKLTDVFYRLHEEGKILNEKKITSQWICDNFENNNQKTGKSPYKFDVVYKQLTDKSGGINKKKRICNDLQI